jgi:hypothetical protein
MITLESWHADSAAVRGNLVLPRMPRIFGQNGSYPTQGLVGKGRLYARNGCMVGFNNTISKHYQRAARLFCREVREIRLKKA